MVRSIDFQEMRVTDVVIDKNGKTLEPEPVAAIGLRPANSLRVLGVRAAYMAYAHLDFPSANA